MVIGNDIVSILIEEIALEGLDGITVQGLWVRLEDRKDFGLKPLTGRVKPLLWNIITKLNCIEFYRLPEPRKQLVIFDKINCLDKNGYNVLPEGYHDIYPHCAVNDEASGVVGSCIHYYTRTNISQQAAASTLDQAFMRWGMELVMVANQDKRRQCLLGPDYDPTMELFSNEYCVLERVGRGRQYGEITQGPWGLKLINDDNKMLFYYRKCLMKKDLIQCQNLMLRVNNTNVGGKVVHLNRYFVPVKSRIQIDIELVISHLKSQPNCMMLYTDLHKLGIKSDVKKLIKKYEKNIQPSFVPYREVYPDATQSQWKCKGSYNEKSIKILRFLTDLKDDETEDKYEDEEETGTGILDESNRYVGVPLVRQAFLLMEKSVISGITQSDLTKHLGVPHLHARSIFKQLKKLKVCGNSMKDIGRQRVGILYCTKYDNLQTSIPNAVAEEKSKLLEIISQEEVKKSYNQVMAKETENTTKPLETKAVEEVPTDLSQTTKIVLKKNHVDTDIKTDIVVLQPDIKSARYPNLLDSGDPSNISLRILKRANLILKAVNNLKIIQDPQKLQRMIYEEEELEGNNYCVDRKSVLRLVEKLELEGHLRRIRITLTGSFKEKVFTFICHPSITPEHSEIQSAIEQAKMKLPIITKDSVKSSSNPLVSFTMKNLQYDHRIGKAKYGFKPKFIRIRNLHFFLYYLVYNYSGQTDLSVINKRNVLSKNNLDSSLLKEMTDIYLDKLDWKMFIPPLPVHEDYGPGWCLVSDVLLRIPLFMFLSLVNIPYVIPGIMEYLEHPLRKNYLVRDLPVEIGNHLTIMRKYIFTIHDILQQMAYIGLLQFGPQMMKEKDQVFIYLNKNAKLMDTTPSEEGYNHISTNIEYQFKSYHFDSTDSVETYWGDLVKFSMNTKLGSKACVVGKEVVVETVATKKEMIEVLKPRTNEEAVTLDVGYIPGDRLGAAGIDSDMFVHLKRNWYWSSTLINTKQMLPEKQSNTKKEDSDSKKSKPNKAKKPKGKSKEKSQIRIKEEIEEEDVPSSSQENRMTVQKTPVTTPECPILLKKCHKKVTRLMMPYKKKSVRKPYYDQQDKEALKRMKKLRVDWTPKEDNILLLCKVANVFMCPYSLRKTMKNYTEIREVLHKMLPELSLNKTSRACQRRIIYMMKNPLTAHSVAICLEELNQDKELVAKYGHATMYRLLTKTFSKQEDHKKTPGEAFTKKFDKLYMELVHILISRLKQDRFTSSILKEDFIPDSINEFYEQYKVTVPCPKKRLDTYVHKEVENDKDIMSSVIKTIIHSSLACIGDKTCYSYQLLHVYQQYPDSLLRTVMGELRSCGILSTKKYTRKYLRNKHPSLKCLPVSTAPFKLSNSYMNRLQTKFQHKIFSDSYYFFANMISQLDRAGSDLEVEVGVANGGECALLTSLSSMDLVNTKIDFPEQVIILDPKLSETEEQFSKVLKRFNDLISNINNVNNKDKTYGYETDFEDLDDSANYEEFTNNNKNCLASAASRLALYALRDECSESSDTNVQHAHDYFVINPCKVFLNFKYDSIDGLQSLFTNFQTKEDLLSKMKKLSTLPRVHNRPDEGVLESTLSEASNQLLQFVREGKEFGVKTSVVIEVFGDDIVHEITDLIDKQLVLQTGAVSLRLIHYHFYKFWVIQSYSLPRSMKDSLATGSEKDNELMDMIDPSTSNSNKRKAEDTDDLNPRKRLKPMSKENINKITKVMESKNLRDMEVVIKPWIRVDGTLNRRVLDRWLGAVLGHTLFMPGLSVEKLQIRFSPAIQPSHVHELVIMLHRLKCVKLYKLSSQPSLSLFSRKSQINIVEATGLEESTDVLVEPDPMAIVKLGLFIGDKAYSGIYMDPENFAYS